MVFARLLFYFLFCGGEALLRKLADCYTSPFFFPFVYYLAFLADLWGFDAAYDGESTDMWGFFLAFWVYQHWRFLFSRELGQDIGGLLVQGRGASEGTHEVFEDLLTTASYDGYIVTELRWRLRLMDYLHTYLFIFRN